MQLPVRGRRAQERLAEAKTKIGAGLAPPAEDFGAGDEAPPHPRHRLAAEAKRRAGIFPAGEGSEIRIEGREHPAIGEAAAIAGIEIALHRQPLGEQDVMPGQLDMEIKRPRRVLLEDRCPVEEALHRHQEVAVCRPRPGGEGDGVVRREAEIAARDAGGESAGEDADRLHQLGPEMAAAIDAALANPDDRRQAPRDRPHPHAGAEILDRDLAPRGHDAGAGEETGQRRVLGEGQHRRLSRRVDLDPALATDLAEIWRRRGGGQNQIERRAGIDDQAAVIGKSVGGDGEGAGGDDEGAVIDDIAGGDPAAPGRGRGLAGAKGQGAARRPGQRAAGEAERGRGERLAIEDAQGVGADRERAAGDDEPLRDGERHRRGRRRARGERACRYR